mgnify:CR=1 FL=1|tara:strand:+ start:109 stop:273 length:165 start_codon:yes stop_codon:yes gene_type:complete
MTFETAKLNFINLAALGVNMMPIEHIFGILAGLTALIYNCLKIYTWFKNRNQKS